MARAEWGLKRTCLSCGARFYDLQREPIVCPACGAAVDATGQSRTRRPRAAPAPARAAPVAVAVAAVAVVEDDAEVETDVEEKEEVAEEEPAEDEDESEDDGESAIEDVSELGNDDMTDVIDTEIDEEETDR